MLSIENLQEQINELKKEIAQSHLNSECINIAYLNPLCKLVKGSNGAIAYDAFANLKEPVVVKKGEVALIPLGFSVDTKDSEIGLFLYIRSGTPKKSGLILMNSVGVIDSDYRGEVMACVYNTGLHGDYQINPQDRLVQVIFQETVRRSLHEVTYEELTKTERGIGGFGSTGL